jgi:hypothetical protein
VVSGVRWRRKCFRCDGSPSAPDVSASLLSRVRILIVLEQRYPLISYLYKYSSSIFISDLDREKRGGDRAAHKSLQYAPRLLHASTKSGISSAVLLTAPHLIVPVSSVAQLPPTCHRFPLGSTSRPQSPSSFPNFLAAICVHGFSKWYVVLTPNPQLAYTSLSSSTMTVIAHLPPICNTHLSVACWELCDTAMKLSRGNLFANRRSSRKVFSATGAQLAGRLVEGFR